MRVSAPHYECSCDAQSIRSSVSLVWQRPEDPVEDLTDAARYFSASSSSQSASRSSSFLDVAAQQQRQPQAQPQPQPQQLPQQLLVPLHERSKFSAMPSGTSCGSCFDHCACSNNVNLRLVFRRKRVRCRAIFLLSSSRTCWALVLSTLLCARVLPASWWQGTFVAAFQASSTSPSSSSASSQPPPSTTVATSVTAAAPSSFTLVTTLHSPDFATHHELLAVQQQQPPPHVPSVPSSTAITTSATNSLSPLPFLEELSISSPTGISSAAFQLLVEDPTKTATTTATAATTTTATTTATATATATTTLSPHVAAFSSSSSSSSFPSSSAVMHQEDPDGLRRRQLILSALLVLAPPPWLFPAHAFRSDGVEIDEDATITTTTFITNQDLQDTPKNDTTTATATTQSQSVIVPPLDDREYRSYTMSNGLRVLLCSDPSGGTTEAAAALAVHVGATSDPKAVAGLAHFTEHMTFLGSKQYPREDSFEAFLATNSGSSNAFTDSEDTVYYFAMDAAADNRLAEGLNRFGSIFREPLFTESATGRELNAIESENAKNLQSDIFRSFQLLKARANPSHPFSKFFTGNKKTLLEETKAQGIDLREQLILFHDSYYSANQMTLAVVAPQSLDVLQNMVEESFGKIPDWNIQRPEQSWVGIAPFSDTTKSIIPPFGHYLEVVPVGELRQVNVAWPVIYASPQDGRNTALLYKPSMYVSHLLGHEGPNSLLSYLKRNGWANALGCATEDQLSDFEIFEIVVGLTTKGLKVVDKVIEAIFSYLKLMHDRTIPAYIFEEVLQLDELQWRFVTKGNAAGYAQSLSQAMQRYPPALYVAGPRRLALDDYNVDPELTSQPRTGFAKGQLDRTRDQVEDYLDFLAADRAMVTILSKTFEGQTDRKEKWYGTDYHVRPIPESTLARWMDPERPSRLRLDFPRPNLFIPTEAGLEVKLPVLLNRENARKKRTFESRMEPIEPPHIIRDDGVEGRWTVYFKQDDRFGKPKGYVVLEVLNKDVFASADNAALSNLLELSISDRLNEYAYDASLAGLIYEVKVLPRGVRLTFGGYNDKLKQFASYICRKLSKEIGDVLPKNDQEFDRYKDQIMRVLSGFDVKQPYAHASYYGQLCLQPHRFQYSNKELRDATRKITLPDLRAYAASLFSSGKGEALLQGNFDEDDALELVKALGDVLPFRPIKESDYPPRLQALPLPTCNSDSVPPRLLIAEPNVLNNNAASYVMLQSLGMTEKDHVLLELISAIVEEPFYNELRTKRQLGYIVSSGIRGIGDTRTLAFIIQSSVATSDALTLEMLRFLDTVEDNLLSKLPKADFAVYVKSLIDRKTEPDKDLSVEVTRNWSEISSGRFQFDRIQREAVALLEVTKEDLIALWQKIYANDGRRVLVTEMLPSQGMAGAASRLPQTSTGYKLGIEIDGRILLGIDDIDQFRRDREKILAVTT